MSHLERIGSRIKVSLESEDGFFGRECPNEDCLGYFKVHIGTGLKGENLPCFCPYCGHMGDHKTFFTQEQIEYAQSVALNKITGAILKDLKEMEFKHDLGFFKMEMKVKGQPQPIKRYREKDLETEVTCEKCTLEYSIYGVFAFCPDCGSHNSLQMLYKNFELAQKEVDLAETAEEEMRDFLLSDALKNAVSAFDGFGREAVLINSKKFYVKDTGPNEITISFQNLLKAQKRINDIFGFDFLLKITQTEINFLNRCFQKRHVLTHRMSVVDQEYLDLTGDVDEVVGRKVSLKKDEVISLINILKELGQNLINEFLKKEN